MTQKYIFLEGDGGPVEVHHLEKMKEMGRRIDEDLNGGVRPRKVGFVLLMFDMGRKGRMNYLSNTNREDMLKGLKELVKNMEAEITGRQQ